MLSAILPAKRSLVRLFSFVSLFLCMISMNSAAQNIAISHPVPTSGTNRSIAPASTVAFPAAGAANSSVQFTITNTSGATLNLTGSPAVIKSGANAADFTVTQPGAVSLTAGASTTFTITYKPSVVAVENATITIASNSTTNGSFVINLKGPGKLLYGALFPPYGGYAFTPTGNIGRSGGVNFAFSTIALAGRTTTYWGPDVQVNGNLAQSLSLDGSSADGNEWLSYSPAESNLTTGVLVWRGQSILNTISGNVTVYTKTILTINTPALLPLTDPATIGLSEQAGGLVSIPANTTSFNANYTVYASTNFNTGFTPYLDFYDNYPQKSCGSCAYISLSSGFYWNDLAPKLTTNGILTMPEGTTGTITAPGLINVIDDEDLPANPQNITFTFPLTAPGANPLNFTNSQLKKGAVTLTGGSTFTLQDLQNNLITYVHDGSEPNPLPFYDQFQFSVTDSKGVLATDAGFTAFTFKINITPVNDAPVTRDTAFTTSYAPIAMTRTLVATDADIPANTLTFSIVTAPTKGTLLLNTATGQFTYTPNFGAPTTDFFTYRVNDGTVFSNTSTVNITQINLPPAATNFNAVTVEDIATSGTITATDPEGGAVTFTKLTNTTKGTSTLSAAGAWTYTPSLTKFGPDYFTYKAQDAQGTLSAEDTVFIRIIPRLDAGDILLADQKRIRIFDPATGQDTTLSLNQGLTDAINLAYKKNTSIFCFDKTTGLIKANPLTGVQSMVAARSGFSAGTPIGGAAGMIIDNSGRIVLADATNGIVRVDTTTGVITPLFNTGSITYATGIVYLANGDLIVTNVGGGGPFGAGTPALIRVTPGGTQTVIASGGFVKLPLDIALIDQNTVVISDAGAFTGGTDRVYKIDLTTGAQTLVTTGGNISVPTGLDYRAGKLYVVNQGTKKLLDVNPTSGVQTIISPATILSSPWGLALVADVMAITNTTTTNEACSGSGGSATITFTGGTAPFNYTVDAGAPVNGISSPITISLTPGTHTIVINDNAGSSVTTTVTITAGTASPVITAPTVTQPTCSTITGTIVVNATEAGLSALVPGAYNANLQQPFRGAYFDSRTQVLYSAAELSAAGLSPLHNITSVAFNMVAKTSTQPYNGFTIKLKNTTTTALDAAGFEAGGTTVYSANYSTVTGVNTFNITPFAWDGTSNLLTEFCWDNSTGTGDDAVQGTVSAANSWYDRQNNNATPGCAISTVAYMFGSGGARPIINFSGNLEYSIDNGLTWQSSPTFSGLNPGNYNIKVRPQSNPSCVSTYSSNPVVINAPTPPTVNAVTNQTACNNGSTTAVTFSGSAVPGVQYNWTNSNPSIGLAASGTGNIASFTAINTGTAPVTATITVTPVAFTCTGTATTFTITVNPSATVNAVSDQSLCNNAATAAVNFTSPTTGGTIVYNWTNNTASIGLAASGTGNIASFTATNTTSAPVVATITVTPSYTNGAATCAGTPITFTITVDPTPDVTQPANQTICNTAATTAVTFSGAVAGTTYSWTNNTTSIGLAASGTGNIGSFNAINAGNAPVTATVTVTPSAGGSGAPVSISMPAQTSIISPSVRGYWFTAPVNFTITSLYVPTDASTGAQSIAVVRFIGNTPPPVFSSTTNAFNTLYLTQNNVTAGNIPVNIPVSAGEVIGILGCRGDVGSYGNGSAGIVIAGNPVTTTRMGMQFNLTTTAPQQLWQEPSSTNISRVFFEYTLNAGCTGTPKTFTYTVNPTATVNAVANQTTCNNTATTAVNFTSPTTGGTIVYNWTNNTTSIGLAASGVGNIPAFTAINTGAAPVTATITVTPSYTNGSATCTGTPMTFTITVTNTPAVNTPANQNLCNNANTTAVTFSGANVYSWTNNTTSIGLAAAGLGNIPSFVATNTGTTPVTATVTVTPQTGVSYRLYQTHGGLGDQSQYGAYVYTAAEFDPLFNLANSNTTLLSSGNAPASVIMNFSNAGQLIGAGIPAPGSGDYFGVDVTSSFTAAETGTYTFGIDGDDGVDLSIDGNIIASYYGSHGFGGYHTGTVSLVAGQTYTLRARMQEFTGGEGLAVAWQRPSQSTLALQTAELGCAGTLATFTYTVNPSPTVTPVSNQSVCNNAATTAITFTGAVSGTVYNWTNNTTSIGLAASGTGNIASFNGTNTTTAPVTATITVTPSYTNAGTTCTGTPITFTITVNPTPDVNTVSNQTICNTANTTAITFSGSVTGTVYNWVNTDPSIGLATSGTGNIPTFAGTNPGTAPVTATVSVTPTYAISGINNALNFDGVNDQVTASVPAIFNNIAANDFTIESYVRPTGNLFARILYAQKDGSNFASLGTGSGNVIYFYVVSGGSNYSIATSGSIPANQWTHVAARWTAATQSVQVFFNGVLQAGVNGGNSSTGTNGVMSIGTRPGGGTQYFIGALDEIRIWGNRTDAQILANYNQSVPVNSAGLVSYYRLDEGTGSTTADATVNANTGTLIGSPLWMTPSTSPIVSGATCNGTPKTFTITVNPTPSVNTVSNQVICNGAPTTAVTFTTPNTGGTMVYNWTNNTTSIGLAASGTGNIASFTATNATNAPVTATITVTPSFINNGTTCTGAPKTFTITVNPTATVDPVGNQLLCTGASTTAVTFASSTTTGSTIVYNWTNNTPGIGLAASGTGNIGSFVTTNTTTGPLVATITVTAAYTNGGATCNGTPRTFTITVNPVATVTPIINQTVCNGAPTTAITFTSPTTGGTIVYNWTNSIPSIGLASSGTGNIASFNAVNTGTAPVTATITVTPVYTNGAVTCTGTAYSFTITVNPTATVNPIGNQVICNGAATTAVVFSSPASGGTVVYNWTNNTTSIGLAASGTGSIASFTATNATTGTVTATITVTPVYTSGSVTCTGTPSTFTITVNPTATVNVIANQVVCNNAATTAVTFTSPTTGGTIVYNWTNNTTSIGLAASGTGNIASFTAINTGTTPVTATITVTPSYTNGAVTCTGTPRTFTITVNPTAIVNPVSNQVVCNGAPTTAVTFSSTATGGTIVYNWTNNLPSVGLAASGSGNIASFNAINTSTAPITATITVTPSYTSGGTTCAGPAITFTITVNPTAVVTPVANQTVCNGGSTNAITFASPTTGGTIVYNWTNNTTSIGLAASGTGNIASFVGTNATQAAVTATIIVTPTYTANGVTCTGTPFTFTITINPTATINPVTSQVVCNNANTTAIAFTSPATGGTVTYNWINNTPSIGLAANGSGNIASFVATNITTAPVVATITVTPTFTNNGVSCAGTPVTFTITVNPTATVDFVANQVVCNTANTTAITFTSPANGGTIVYNWTNNTPSIGLAASGTGNIASFVATNAGTAPVVAAITVTPSYTNGGTTCVGTPRTFTITVNPTATVNTVANQVVCNNAATTAITFTSPATGGTIVYNWTNNTTSIGLAATGTGNIASFTATNTTNAPVVATITVTPSYTNSGTTCIGTPRTFTITVNPTATINTVANQVICNNAPTTAITFTSATTGGTIVYNWTNNTTSIGLAASGTGNIASFTATNTTNAPVTATITVTPSYSNGGTTCTGTAITFTITVNPTATVNAVANQVVCNNSPTAAITFTSPTTGGAIVYNWTNNTPAIGLAASGTGNIASFTATNTTNAPVTATITVTPSYTNGGTTCVGTPLTFTITVNPTATVNTVANQVICNNSPTTAITFTSPTTGGTIVYNWTNNTTSIGLAASGTGNIASFTATNTTNAPVTATITVTPSYTNGGTTCVGTPITFTITVNPTATINTVANQVICNNAPTTAITFTSATTGGTIVYNWTNNTTSIGLAASGTGNIASFTATNTTNAPVTATITVTPSYTNGGTACTGTAITFTITVNPTATVNAVANQVVCNNSPTTAITFTSPTTGGTIVYNWTNNTPAIGLAASGTGDIASFTAVNTTTGPLVATITVTPSYTNGGITCIGTPRTFTITVNPVATVNTVANQVVCNNSPTTAITFTSPTTGGTIVYNWTNNTTSIGLAASGTGNIASFTATNTTTGPVTATITVTPSFTNGAVTCVGTPRTFTITVNPTATVNTVTNQVVCNNTPTAAIIFTSPTTGGTIVYNWTNNTPAIGLAASGTGNIASFTAVNTTTGPLVATITVTPSYTNGSVTCIGTPRTFTITVNPVSTVNPVANQTVCHNSPTTAITFTSPTTGGTIVYNWTNNTPSIGLAASGTGDIPSFTAINTGAAAVTATITVTPSYTNGSVTCTGTPITFTITVNTLSSAPLTITTTSSLLCGPGMVTFTANGGFTGTGGIYKWYSGSCGGTPVATGQTITINVLQTTTYYVRIEGTCNTTACASTVIAVFPQPAVTLAAVPSTAQTPGSQVVLYATVSPVGTYNYQWYYKGVLINTAHGDTLHVPSDKTGDYYVFVRSLLSGCSATSPTITITDAVKPQLFVTPNPNNGQFNVSAYAGPEEFGTTRQLMIFDGKGSRIYIKGYVVTVPYNNMSVDIRGHANGVYFISLINAKGKIIATSQVLLHN